MKLTKKTIATYATSNLDDPRFVDEAFKEEYAVWLNQLIGANKTPDFNSYHPTVTTALRRWSDQAAAEEYVQLMTPLCQKYNINLISIEISDY
jgi:hypothetical protein